MKSQDIAMQQSEILAQLHEGSRKAAIKHDREMRIHNVVGIVLRLAFIFSVAMAVMQKQFC